MLMGTDTLKQNVYHYLLIQITFDQLEQQLVQTKLVLIRLCSSILTNVGIK